MYTRNSLVATTRDTCSGALPGEVDFGPGDGVVRVDASLVVGNVRFHGRKRSGLAGVCLPAEVERAAVLDEDRPVAAAAGLLQVFLRKGAPFSYSSVQVCTVYTLYKYFCRKTHI